MADEDCGDVGQPPRAGAVAEPGLRTPAPIASVTDERSPRWPWPGTCVAASVGRSWERVSGTGGRLAAGRTLVLSATDLDEIAAAAGRLAVGTEPVPAGIAPEWGAGRAPDYAGTAISMPARGNPPEEPGLDRGSVSVGNATALRPTSEHRPMKSTRACPGSLHPRRGSTGYLESGRVAVDLFAPRPDHRIASATSSGLMKTTLSSSAWHAARRHVTSRPFPPTIGGRGRDALGTFTASNDAGEAAVVT